MVKKLHDELPKKVKICNGSGKNGTEPVITPTEISFNGCCGSRDLCHETFYLDTKETGFQFTKTAEKPYDLLVTSSLLALKTVARGKVKVSSDGDRADWADGEKLFEQVTGLKKSIFTTPRKPKFE